MSATRYRPRKHRGVRLGRSFVCGIEPMRYRVRHGRELCLVTVAGLTREWLDVYVAWYRELGFPEHAMRLKRDWMRERGPQLRVIDGAAS